MRILDTQTGISVEVPENYDCSDYEDLGKFMWTEHNWSCDCNRALIHARARGVADPSEELLVCGDSRYKLLDVPWEKK